MMQESVEMTMNAKILLLAIVLGMGMLLVREQTRALGIKIIGVLAVLLVIAGVRRSRRGRRRLMQQRIEDLRDQNARLATQRNLEAVIHIPEAEPVDVAEVPESDDVALPPPPASVSAKDEPASKW